MDTRGHFFYSSEQHDIMRGSRMTTNFCVINGKKYEYTQWQTAPKWYGILYHTGLIKVNGWPDTKYLGYGDYAGTARAAIAEAKEA